MSSNSEMLDAVVIGGGPAGLSCALWLARYRRSVRVFDTSEPRNRPAWAVHGFPGIPSPPPLELRARMREQALQAGAEYIISAVARVSGEKDAFTVSMEDGARVRARRVVLAYGLRDFIPDVPGIRDFYGHSVYHCPDCDGPSVSGGRIGVIGHDRHAAALSLYLLTWSERVSVLTNGVAADLDDDVRAVLTDNGIDVHEQRIHQLRGREGCLEEVLLDEADPLPLEALFFHLGSEPRCMLAHDLGCAADADGYIDVDRGQQTSIPGIYAAGDLSGHPHLAVSAAAEGVRAALAIHRSLLPEAFSLGR